MEEEKRFLWAGPGNGEDTTDRLLPGGTMRPQPTARGAGKCNPRGPGKKRNLVG